VPDFSAVVFRWQKWAQEGLAWCSHACLRGVRVHLPGPCALAWWHHTPALCATGSTSTKVCGGGGGAPADTHLMPRQESVGWCRLGGVHCLILHPKPKRLQRTQHACNSQHALNPLPALLPSSPPWTAKVGQGRGRKGKVGACRQWQLRALSRSCACISEGCVPVSLLSPPSPSVRLTHFLFFLTRAYDLPPALLPPPLPFTLCLSTSASPSVSFSASLACAWC